MPGTPGVDEAMYTDCRILSPGAWMDFSQHVRTMVAERRPAEAHTLCESSWPRGSVSCGLELGPGEALWPKMAWLAIRFGLRAAQHGVSHGGRVAPRDSGR